MPYAERQLLQRCMASRSKQPPLPNRLASGSALSARQRSARRFGRCLLLMLACACLLLVPSTGIAAACLPASLLVLRRRRIPL